MSDTIPAAEPFRPRVLIATPTYNAQVHASYMLGVLGAFLGLGHRYDLQHEFVHGTLVDKARDALAERALELDADWLVFIDSDIGFHPSALRLLLAKAAETAVPVLAIPYLRRSMAKKYFSVRPLPSADPPVMDSRGICEVLGAPTGFMAIRREVLLAVARYSDEATLSYRHADGTMHRRFFAFGYSEEGFLLGEDFTFCELARSLGFPVFVLPGIELTHEGAHGYVGTWTPSEISAD